MKIKIKDEMNEINIKVNHQELRLIEEALKEYKPSIYIEEEIKFLQYLNDKLFDKYEFNSVRKIYSKKEKMTKKISKILNKIKVW